eukprot:5777796-Ditylum_brightwellii.AAC.1
MKINTKRTRKGKKGRNGQTTLASCTLIHNEMKARREKRISKYWDVEVAKDQISSHAAILNCNERVELIVQSNKLTEACANIELDREHEEHKKKEKNKEKEAEKEEKYQLQQQEKN